jgi:hypothetical protein
MLVIFIIILLILQISNMILCCMHMNARLLLIHWKNAKSKNQRAKPVLEHFAIPLVIGDQSRFSLRVGAEGRGFQIEKHETHTEKHETHA